MLKNRSRGAQLRALNRLLNYTPAESKELGLAHLDKLLGAAALAVGDEIDNVESGRLKTEASGERPPPES